VQGETIHCTTNQQRSLKDGTVNNTSNDYMVSRTHRFHQSKQRILLIRRKRYQVVFLDLMVTKPTKTLRKARSMAAKIVGIKTALLRQKVLVDKVIAVNKWLVGNQEIQNKVFIKNIDVRSERQLKRHKSY
jgi:hypothetical protein